MKGGPFTAFVALLGLVLVSVNAQDQPQCGACDRSTCPKIDKCLGGMVMDVCGCCFMCARGLGQRCDEEGGVTGYGPCGEFLECKKRTDIGHTDEAHCECEEEGPVCGSDGVTYDTLCHLLQNTPENPDLTLISREPCNSVPTITTRPKDAVRPPGSIMVLDCEAKGFPVPVMTWEINRSDGSSMVLPSDDPGFAVQVRGGPEKHMITGWVQIMRITEETIGTFTCVATNSKGESRASATITLRSPGEKEELYNEV